MNLVLRGRGIRRDGHRGLAVCVGAAHIGAADYPHLTSLAAAFAAYLLLAPLGRTVRTQYLTEQP